MANFSDNVLRKSAMVCLTVSNDGKFYDRYIRPTFQAIGAQYKNDPANYSPTWGALRWAAIVPAAITYGHRCMPPLEMRGVQGCLARHLESKWREATYQAMGIAVADIPEFPSHDKDIASDYEY